MPYVYLILAALLNSTFNIFGKLFNRKYKSDKDESYLYNLLVTISATIGWGLIYAFNFSFDVNVLVYSLIFGACSILGFFGTIKALMYGSATLTSLIISLSLMLTTIWGFIFWNSSITILVVIGLFFVVLSLFLCLYSKGNNDKSISFKWLFYVSLAFFGNAGCSIVQKTQQIHFEGNHGSMLMFFAMMIDTIFFLIIYLKSDKTNSKQLLKQVGWIPTCAGFSNTLLNLFIILLATTSLSPSLIYPVVGVGGLSFVTIFSFIVFKEKMQWWKLLGVLFGAIGVVLLSI